MTETDLNPAWQEQPPVDPAPEAQRQSGFVRLLGQHYRPLYSYIFALVADLHQADDLMQDVSLILWQRFDEFEPGTDFVRWGRAIIRNVVRNHRRTFWNRKFTFCPELMNQLLETQGAVEELLELRLVALRSCLDKLSSGERALVRSFYEKGHTLAGTARDSGKSPEALQKSISRIRLKLSQCIDRSLRLDNV